MENNDFFEKPVLNSPYDYPARHWELDEKGQPTQKIIASRRRAEFITPIPKAKKTKQRQNNKSYFLQKMTVFLLNISVTRLFLSLINYAKM